jgi:DNA-binding NarL/FixJ family response regulator
VSLSLLDRSDQTTPFEPTDGRDEPAGHGPGSTPAPRSSVGPPDEPAPPGSRVLVVDDTNSIRTELRCLLEEAGLTVVGEGSHGAEGVMLARELRPDVVLMDVRMPILDGIAATGYIRRELPDTRVIVFSAFDDQELTATALAAGASGFIAKGASPAEIAAAVRDAAHGA